MIPAAARSLSKTKDKIKQTPAQKRASSQHRKASTVKPGKTGRESRKGAGLGKRMFSAILITGLLIGSLALRAQVIDGGYELHLLERALAATQTEYDRLNLSIAQLSSLARIEKEATVSLGMAEPVTTEFIMVASATNRLDMADNSDSEMHEKLSGLVAHISARTEDILIGLISPFVARWFYDIPRSSHPRIRLK